MEVYTRPGMGRDSAYHVSEPVKSKSESAARDAYSKASAHLKRANSDVRRVTQNLGRSSEGPWRAEQKLAALASWFALSR
jgi:hypothetical protein